MNIGIDFGNCITSRNLPAPYIIDNAFESVSKLVKKFDNTYIVSRVNSEQMARARSWIKDVNFCAETGIKEENIYFCFDRRDKAIFVRGLNINVFIDDRPNVLSHMDESVKKILFNPSEADIRTFGVYEWGFKDMIIVKNWLEVEKLLL